MRLLTCNGIRILAFLCLLAAPVAADAVPYSFDNITNNNARDAAIGEAQLQMDVTQVGNQVFFTFTNTGLDACSITDIYFDDDVPLLSFVGLNQTKGVDFSEGASPGDLPSGMNYLFSTNYSYDSNPPAQPNGINPGEYLTIVFAYENSYNFNDVLNGLNNGSFRVGLHVQGFDSEGSESFINNTAPVPEPSTMLLLGSGMSALAVIRARRKAKSK